jgi:hypothetical protein
MIIKLCKGVVLDSHLLNDLTLLILVTFCKLLFIERLEVVWVLLTIIILVKRSDNILVNVLHFNLF